MSIHSILGAAAVALPHRVSIYVPGTVGVAEQNSEAAREMVERVAGQLSTWFGGATSTAASGFWVSEQVGLVREAVTVVYANTTEEELEQRGQDVLALALDVKRVMEQEAVSVEIDGALYLV